MEADDAFEQAVQALLDGRPLASVPGHGDQPAAGTAVRIMDALARAHRLFVLGREDASEQRVETRWGHLEIRGEIGRGSSGVVYRAWDPRLARHVALKLLDNDHGEGDSAIEEGRLLARLNHPHIVRVFGADTHDGTAGIWMELLDGDTLDDVLARDGTFSAEEVLLAGQHLAGALAAVHAAGLLHRDIKARNVIRERGGRLVLTDLGAGRPFDIPGAEGDEIGTPICMAPEVLAGQPASTRSDLYSLGVLLYRLLSGTFPVTASSLSQLRASHASAERTPLGQRRPDVAAEVIAVVEQACGHDAAARFASASELETACRNALVPALAHRLPLDTPFQRTVATWGRVLFATLATCAVLGISGWLAWETPVFRAVRRAAGLPLPPRSALYLTMNGAAGIVRGNQLTLLANNPGSAFALAVSPDLGFLTLTGGPPWVSGGGFQLDGTPSVRSAPSLNGLCCFGDGTTDGQFNYALRQDSTLAYPIGSKTLARSAVYRFARDWSNPTLLFPVHPTDTYAGIAYSEDSGSLWLTRNSREGARIEQWSRDGKEIANPIRVTGATLLGLAVDPSDDTLWAVQANSDDVRLENFAMNGTHLGGFAVPHPHPYLQAVGAEFEWRRR